MWRKILMYSFIFTVPSDASMISYLTTAESIKAKREVTPGIRARDNPTSRSLLFLRYLRPSCSNRTNKKIRFETSCKISKFFVKCVLMHQ